MTVSAVSPWRMAFRLERRLPDDLRGPARIWIKSFSVPAIKPKDPVGFRDRVPALDVRELTPISFARADMTVIEIAPQRLHLFC